MRDLTRGLLARIKRLEAALPAATPTFWDWWLGGADRELLTGADRDFAEEWLGIRKRPPPPDCTAVQIIRQECARLSIPEPADYAGIDIIEEALRLVALPDPATPLPNGLKELPATEPPPPREPA
jgi:hypothetical protein